VRDHPELAATTPGCTAYDGPLYLQRIYSGARLQVV